MTLRTLKDLIGLKAIGKGDAYTIKEEAIRDIKAEGELPFIITVPGDLTLDTHIKAIQAYIKWKFNISKEDLIEEKRRFIEDNQYELSEKDKKKLKDYHVVPVYVDPGAVVSTSSDPYNFSKMNISLVGEPTNNNTIITDHKLIIAPNPIVEIPTAADVREEIKKWLDAGYTRKEISLTINEKWANGLPGPLFEMGPTNSLVFDGIEVETIKSFYWMIYTNTLVSKGTILGLDAGNEEFNKDFPGLVGKIYGWDPEGMELEEDGNMVNVDDISKNCRDKQKVRDTITRVLDSPITEEEKKSPSIVKIAFDKFRKELDL